MNTPNKLLTSVLVATLVFSVLSVANPLNLVIGQNAYAENNGHGNKGHDGSKDKSHEEKCTADEDAAEDTTSQNEDDQTEGSDVDDGCPDQNAEQDDQDEQQSSHGKRAKSPETVKEKHKEKIREKVESVTSKQIHERHVKAKPHSPGDYAPGTPYILHATSVGAADSASADFVVDMHISVWKSNKAIVLMDVMDGTVSSGGHTYDIALGYGVYSNQFDVVRLSVLVVDESTGEVLKLKLSGKALEANLGDEIAPEDPADTTTETGDDSTTESSTDATSDVTDETATDESSQDTTSNESTETTTGESSEATTDESAGDSDTNGLDDDETEEDPSDEETADELMLPATPGESLQLTFGVSSGSTRNSFDGTELQLVGSITASPTTTPDE